MIARETIREELTALEKLGVDLTEERALLDGAEGSGGTVLLVAGTQNSRVYDMMEGLGIQWDKDNPHCPVECTWGDSFSLRITDHCGAEHVFYRQEDFRRTIKASDIRRCLLTCPAPLLKAAHIRFLDLGGVPAAQYPELAGDCSGFLLTLPCRAGAPGQEMQDFTKWIRDIRRIPARAGVAFNHVEEPGIVQTALALFLYGWLGVEDAPTWQCGYGGEGRWDTPSGILEEAVSTLAAPGTAPGDTGILQSCAQQCAQKATELASSLSEEAKKHTEAAEWATEAQRQFRAKGQNAGVHLTFSLSDQQKQAIRQDVQGMVKMLKEQIPQMIEDLVEKNGEDAKQDLKNLTGDYMEMVLQTYLMALAEQIARNSWFDQAQKAFDEVVRDFQNLKRQSSVELDSRVNTEREQLLKIVEINLGNYITGFAQLVGKAVSVGVTYLINRVIRWVTDDMFSGGGFSRWLGGKIGILAEHAADDLLPPKLYGQFIEKALIKELDGMGEPPADTAQKKKKPADNGTVSLSDSLFNQIMPAVGGQIRQQYNEMVESVCDNFAQFCDRQKTQAEKLAAQSKELSLHAQTLDNANRR